MLRWHNWCTNQPFPTDFFVWTKCELKSRGAAAWSEEELRQMMWQDYEREKEKDAQKTAFDSHGFLRSHPAGQAFMRDKTLRERGAIRFASSWKLHDAEVAPRPVIFRVILEQQTAIHHSWSPVGGRYTPDHVTRCCEVHCGSELPCSVLAQFV